MGHQHRRTPPTALSWKAVNHALADGMAVAVPVAAAAEMLKREQRAISEDVGVSEALRVLAALSLWSAGRRFDDERSLLVSDPLRLSSFAAVAGALGDSLDDAMYEAGAVSQLAARAESAAVAGFAGVLAGHPTSGTAASLLAPVAGAEGFGRLAEAYAQRLIHSMLDGVLCREYPLHLGPGRRFEALDRKMAFAGEVRAHVDTCCAGVAPIAQAWLEGMPADRHPTAVEGRELVSRVFDYAVGRLVAAAP